MEEGRKDQGDSPAGNVESEEQWSDEYVTFNFALNLERYYTNGIIGQYRTVNPL